jgi:hypothetical protein
MPEFEFDPNGADSYDPTKWESDIRPGDELLKPDEFNPAGPSTPGERVAVVRNSDRALFRRCRRRWGWSSHLKANLEPSIYAAPLWFGSGFHFALEDFHGYQNYPDAMHAFLAYVDASKRRKKHWLPPDLDELTQLGLGMLDYYTNYWLVGRDSLRTFVYKGVPQVEVNFRIELPWERGKFGWDRAVYSGTIDRVSIDDYGNLWILEYKTAKSIFTQHLSMDGQVNSYCWAGNHLYPDHPGRVVGVIYQQHRKSLPDYPRILANGSISTNAQMLTTHRFYRKTLLDIFGSIEQSPKKNVDYLNWLTTQEDMDRDKFVQRDRVYRNEHQCQAEGEKIMLELSEILNPDTPLYPSPARDCAFFCPFSGPCVSLDDGSDYQEELNLMMQSREKDYDLWRQQLQPPESIKLIPSPLLPPLLNQGPLLPPPQ